MATVRRLGWGVADQGVSSLSNFALGVVAAKSLDPAGFGAFTLAYLTYAFVLSAARGPSTDPLMVRFSYAEPTVWRRAVAASSATAMAGGVLAGALCVLAGLLLPGDLGGAFLALGVGLPGLMLQDSYRFAFFSAGRGEKALINDAFWGVTMLATLVALVKTDRADVVSCVLAFGATATLAAGLGCLQCRVSPRPQAVVAWLRDHRDLGGRYLLENVSIGASRHLRMVAVGAIAGLAAVGEIRGAEILMGPILILVSGVSQVAVPEVAAVAARSAKRVSRFCAWLGAVQASCALVWAVVIAVLLPRGVGDLLIGDLWEAAAALLLPVAALVVIGCFEVAAAAGVRALAASRRSLAAQLMSAGIYLVLGTAGAALDGARGACWGAAAAALVASVLWWVQLSRAITEHRASPVASPRDPSGDEVAAGSPTPGQPRRSEPHLGRR